MYIVNSTFYIKQFKSFILGVPPPPPPGKPTNLVKFNCLLKIFLHCEFQISMLSSSKVLFLFIWGIFFGQL